MKTRLISKRNEVLLVEENDNIFISKIFSDKTCLDNEYKYLKLLQNFAVPKVLDIKNNNLFLEYIDGKIFIDEFMTCEEQNKSPDFLINILLDWLDNFYKLTKKHFGKQHIIDDINFRNFIIKENEIYGIDFEQCHTGEIEYDIGKMSAFAIMYEPIKTKWKMNFLEKFLETSIDKFNLDKQKVYEYFELELKSIYERRKKG
ncbi:MAG: hypothetical protein R3Y33_07900 [Clostridia bacterium]